MNQLFAIYGWTIVASVFLAAGLALLGCQLAARDRAMQTLCMGQGAMLGVLLGLGIVQTLLHDEPLATFLPLILALVVAALTFVLSERLVAHRMASSNTHFASLFALLLAGGYLVSALFPALENHMAQKYFGDLATISSGESYAGIAVGILLVGLMALCSRSFTQASFEKAITGEVVVSSRWLRLSRFDLLSLVVLCFCVQTVGYLFTIACLFIPTAIASRTLAAGLNRHLSFCAIVAAFATGLGFCLSLNSNILPTVPTIISCLLLVGLLVSLFLGKGRSLQRA